MRRLIEFSDRHQVRVNLVYFPPYHSKYNPIERVWGILERHWNGTLLATIETALRWSATITWKGQHPLVRRIESVYKTRVKLTRLEFAKYASRLKRSETLRKWSVTILPRKTVLY